MAFISQACIPYNGFDALMKIASFDFEGDDKSSTSPIFNEHKLCIHLGVFQISLQIFLFNLNIFKSCKQTLKFFIYIFAIWKKVLVKFK